MNAPQQSQRADAEVLLANETLIPRAPQRTPEPSSAPAARRYHAGFVALVLMGGIGLVVYLLRGVPADVLRQEFESLGIVSCALASVGIFLRRVTRALAQDARQAEEADHSETLPVTRTPAQSGSRQYSSGNATRLSEPVELRT
jgi:hypothetical protein